MKQTITFLINLFVGIASFAVWLILVLLVSQNAPLVAGGLFSLKFFTTLSNLLNGAACLAYASCLLRQKEPGVRVRSWKLAGTAAVGLTFFTVMFFLGPAFGFGAALAGTNFWLHLLLPVLSLVSFSFLERGEKLPFSKTFWPLVFVLIYSVGYLGNVLIQGPGAWPNRHDFYGFLTWGWPIGVAIASVLVFGVWVLAVILRALNGRKPQ